MLVSSHSIRLFLSVPSSFSLLLLFICAVVSLCSKSRWFTPSNSQAPAAKKLLVFLRDFPHLLRVYFFILSLSPPPASTSSFLSHTLLLWPHFFFPFTHSCLLSLGFFSAPFFLTLLVLLLYVLFAFPFSLVSSFSLSASLSTRHRPLSLYLSIDFLFVWVFVAVVHLRMCVFICPPASTGVVSYCKLKKITGIKGKVALDYSCLTAALLKITYWPEVVVSWLVCLGAVFSVCLRNACAAILSQIFKLLDFNIYLLTQDVKKCLKVQCVELREDLFVEHVKNGIQYMCVFICALSSVHTLSKNCFLCSKLHYFCASWPL